MPTANYLKIVRDQYEDLPYPPRDPERETRRLGATYIDGLDQVNYYCFEGKQSFDKGFRVLVAGGGTGDCTVFMAEQLRDTNAEIVHLDISEASMAVARQRADVRGLSNIVWLHDSLLDLPGLDIGKFDYVNCSGVLHHIESPAEGLRALKSVLKKNGAMGIMVYGRYGRTAVCQMQELMRLVNGSEDDPNVRLSNCRKVLGSLPKSNWFKMTEDRVPDWKIYGDPGVYDLFLHAQDRAYSVPEVYDLIESCGLVLRNFTAAHGAARRLYAPETYIEDSEMLESIRHMDLKEQQAIAELLGGRLIKHAFHASVKPVVVPQPDDLSNVPFYAGHFEKHDTYQRIREAIEKSSESKITIRSGGITIGFTRTPHTGEIFSHMDGKRTLRAIFDRIIRDCRGGSRTAPTRAKLSAEFAVIFEAFTSYDWMFLRHRSALPLKSHEELQSRVSALQEAVV